MKLYEWYFMRRGLDWQQFEAFPSKRMEVLRIIWEERENAKQDKKTS